MNPIKAYRLWREINKIEKAMKGTNMYDIKVGAAKAIRDFVITAGAVAAAAICGYFSVDANIAAFLGFLPDTVQHALIPIISSAFVFAANWLRERNKGA